MNGFTFYAPDDETFHNVLGYAITEWRYGFARLEMDVKPRHLAGGGYVHGGVLMGLIDVAALYAGNYVDGKRRPLVTINLATSFISSGRCSTPQPGCSSPRPRSPTRTTAGWSPPAAAASASWCRPSRPARRRATRSPDGGVAAA